MKDFVAIDFETANSERSSVCSIGIVIVRDGVITDSFYSTIQPEPNYYSYWCTKVHGLTKSDTEESPRLAFTRFGNKLNQKLAICPLLRTLVGLMRAVLKRYLRYTKWIIPITFSSIHLVLHDENSPIYPTINCILLLKNVAIA